MQPQHTIYRLKDILNDAELDTIMKAPLYQGTRHPTWFPLSGGGPSRAADHLVNGAVSQIATEPNGTTWLYDIKERLLDLNDPSGASSALAEIRAYGGLLHAGFKVKPIPRRDDSTPDFTVNAGDGEITVEVFSKHQDQAEDRLLDAVHSESASLPLGVERRTRAVGDKRITTTIVCVAPGGKPDPGKPNDSVQANVIQRICGIKKNEKQIPAEKPAILIVDLAHFGGPIAAEFIKGGQACPIESGHGGLTSGALWYAFYGWKDAAIFEEGERKQVRMGHDGRFRFQDAKKTKLSGVLVVLSGSSLFLENPWATHRLPDAARTALCRYPWFDLTRSIFDFHPGDALTQIEIHANLITAMDKRNPWPQDI